MCDHRLVLFLVAMIAGGTTFARADRPSEPPKLEREHLLSFTGSGSMEEEGITLYLEGMDPVPEMGDQRITIGDGKTFRMCVVRGPNGNPVALDLLGVRRNPTGQVTHRTVERLPMPSLRREGVRFRVDPWWLADLFVRDPVAFRVRVRRFRRDAFTIEIRYLDNYDEEIRNTLVLHARRTREGWNLIRHGPVDHRIKPELQLVNRTQVRGVRIETIPVDPGGTLHRDRGE